MNPADYPEMNNDLSDLQYSIISEQSPENFRIVNLVKYSVIIILSVAAVLINYALLTWMAKNITVQLLIVRMLMMSFIPIIAMSFLCVLVVKGMQTAFGRVKRNIKIVRYNFYGDHFEIVEGARLRSFGYEKLIGCYRILDHIVLIIKGMSPQYLPPQVFENDIQMLNFETFLRIKLK